MEDKEIKIIKKIFEIIIVLLLILIILGACIYYFNKEGEPSFIDINNIPEYSGEPSIIINGNEPEFDIQDYSDKSYEYYSDLDSQNRCGYSIANIGTDLMPTDKREEIWMIKPTGWHWVRYEGIEDDLLYNRCHVIGFQLTGENANDKNLITGTRYLNTQGMLPYENMVADYIRKTGNHVLYRVTPIFEGDNLVCSGVHMEAKSVEDDGKGIKFNVYCYNVQPGITIDYKTGDSTGPEFKEETNFVLNNNSKKFHRSNCESINTISPNNIEYYTGDRQDLIEAGYSPCGACRP